MSELINNREYRKKIVKEIILGLHEGKPVEELKGKFHEVIKDVAPTEISAIEQELINEGLPIGEVQRLCDVHASLFKESLENVVLAETSPGHPVYTFKAENRALEKLMEEEIKPILVDLGDAHGEAIKTLAVKLTEKFNLLWDMDKHYSRKENLLFPFLEKYEIMGPPKVMWGVDDEIRASLKEAKALAVNYDPEQKDRLIAQTEETLNKIDEMIFKEEKILFPMAFETLTEDEWYQIMEDSGEIGYCLIEPEKGWQPSRENVSQKVDKIADQQTKGHIKFDTGILTPEEISLIFNHMPVDITFVDKDGIVKYFSNTKERIFARTRTIIGRKVENCHPPASVHVVEQLVEDFQSGKKDREDFWLHLGDKYVLIQYFAVRDEAGNFTGVLEVSQDINLIQAITGDKRIMD